MRTTLLVGACLLLGANAAAQAPAKPKFHGTWTLDSQKSELKNMKLNSAKLVIGQEKVAEIAFRQAYQPSDGAERVVEFKCTTTGKECAFTVGTTPATISLFYSGPVLVGFERSGGSGSETVTRYNLSLSEDGNTLTIECTQLEPPKPDKDKLVYVKQ
jgi:hypothetical protein